MNTTANANLFSRLFDKLDDPGRLAIEELDGNRISYADLIARAGRMANVLVSRGVKVGDRVAAQTEKSVAALVLYLATVRAGAIYLPLNTAYTLNELEYFIGDAEPSLVVCDPAKAEEWLAKEGQGSLLGFNADECLPKELAEVAMGAAGQSNEVILADDRRFRAIAHRMGAACKSQGSILAFFQV